jgi:hypothetical protein
MWITTFTSRESYAGEKGESIKPVAWRLAQAKFAFHQDEQEGAPSKLRLGGVFDVRTRREREARGVILKIMSGDKTFYLETFGCQMNVHDSEKVIGTLLHEGYRQVESVEQADLILYNTWGLAQPRLETKESRGCPIQAPLGWGFPLTAPLWCTLVQMPPHKQVRRSVTLPAQIAQQVERIAKRRRLSDNRVLVELIEEGIEAREQKEKEFFQLAEKFRAADDPEQVKRLGDELGKMVFGE